MSLNPIPIDDSSDYVEPFYNVDEEEAKDIDSCLNFLSILDEETSNDSCNFTLFRKKDDKPNDTKVSENDAQSKVLQIENREQKDDLICRATTQSLNNIYKDSNDSEDNVDNSKDLKDAAKGSDNLTENVDSSKNFNNIFSSVEPKLSDATTSQNIKIISSNIFKIGDMTIKPNLISVTKIEPSAIIRMKDNIILKVSSSPLKKNSTLDKSNSNILSSLNSDVSKRNTSSSKLNLNNHMSLVTSPDNCSPSTDFNVLNAEQTSDNIIDRPSVECVNLSHSENDMSDSFLDDKIQSSIINESISTVCTKIKETSTVNKESKNIIKTIKVLSVKQILSQLKVEDVSSTELSPVTENAVTAFNNNNSEYCTEDNVENNCINSLENAAKKISDENSLDFISLNPYNAVEIIKKPEDNIKLDNETDNSKVKFRVLAARKRCKKAKKKQTIYLSTSLKHTNKKPIKRMKKIYTPLERTELPTFIKKSGLQENLINLQNPDDSHSGATVENIVDEKHSSSAVNNLYQDVIDGKKSQSSEKSFPEAFQLNATNNDKINTLVSLNIEQNLLEQDANFEGMASSFNSIDQLVDHNSYCQSKDEGNSVNNKIDNDIFSEKKQLSKKNDKMALELNNLLHSSEVSLSGISEKSIMSESNSSECTEVLTTFSDIQKSIGDSCSTSLEKNIPVQEEVVVVQEEVVSSDVDTNEISANSVYSYNRSSPLTFTVQNILENMFKYETFLSSTNMARLAKIVGAQWRDIRDWFVGRRNYSKRNGLYLRNQSLTSCSYCPNYKPTRDEKAIVHLLSREHIENMMTSMENYNRIFTKVQKDNCNKLNGKVLDDTKVILKIDEHKSKEEIEIAKVFPYRDRNKLEDSKQGGQKVWTETKTYTKENRSLASKPSARFAKVKMDNVFKRPMIPSEKLRENSVMMKGNVKKYKNIDSKIFIGYRCPVCLKIFNTEWMLLRHSLSHRKLTCGECGEVFLREDLLKHHFKQHIIESMDDDLYSLYVCFKCFNLNCICEEARCAPPSLNCKRYIRPQMAKRSKPFRSAPYSGVNEHLKVTLDEFWQKYKTRKPKLGPKTDKLTPQLNAIKVKVVQKPTPPAKQDKKINPKSNSAPTYTKFTTFNCSICESFFFTPDELKEHLTVHKIQARNRSKRSHETQEADNLETKKVKYTKPSTLSPLHGIFTCFYCGKNFKTQNILSKHFRRTCKSVPGFLIMAMRSGTSIHIEKVNDSNRYKLRVEANNTTADTKVLSKPPKVKCDLCFLELLPDQLECHKRVCNQNLKEKSNKPHSSNVIKEENLEVNNSLSESKDNIEFYFICKYCDAPLDSQKLLMSHVKSSCKQVPNEVLSELEAQRLSSVEICIEKYYTKIERQNLLKALSLTTIQRILDEVSFLNVQKNYKRVKCKFCDKVPLKSCLKLHLLQQCKHVPEEFQNLMEIYGKAIFNSTIKINESSTQNEGVTENSSREVSENEESSSREEIQSLETGDSKMKQDVLYDCHLCEEKFKISKDFITHMQNFHCMSISEESAYKWLTNLNSDDFDIEENATKNDDVDSKNNATKIENIDHEEILIKNEIYHDDQSPTKSSKVQEEKLTYNTISSEVLDESLLGYIVPLEVPGIPSSMKNKKTINNAQSKSQKLDDELFNDLTNLDNFIETVQLEDVNFESS